MRDRSSDPLFSTDKEPATFDSMELAEATAEIFIVEHPTWYVDIIEIEGEFFIEVGREDADDDEESEDDDTGVLMTDGSVDVELILQDIDDLLKDL